MTQAPTPGPLNRESVKLLVKGDLLRRTDNAIGQFERLSVSGLVVWNPYREKRDPSEILSFIGRPDADGWMPWSGGENPVPGQMVEVRLRNGRPPFTEPSNGLSWSHDANEVWSAHQITAFRLAPTAPVEASGSERWTEDMERERREADYERGFRDGQNSRPQPSGETRENDLLRRAKGMKALGAHSINVRIDELEAVLLSARPLASGGQHSGEEGIRLDRLRDWINREVPAGTKSATWWVCQIDAALTRAEALSDDDARRRLIQRIEQWDSETEYDAEDIAALADDILHEFKGAPVIARAEAQDEGAAGEPVAWQAMKDGRPLGSVWPYSDRCGADLWLSGGVGDEVRPLYAHPSPTPAADPVSIVPPHCTGIALSFEPGVLHVSKDGSGYIAIDEKHFELEDDRCEGPDGPEGSLHWITRLDASEVVALRDFLNGAPPAADADRVRIAVEALEPFSRLLPDGIWQEDDDVECVVQASHLRAVAEALAALKSEGK